MRESEACGDPSLEKLDNGLPYFRNDRIYARRSRANGSYLENLG
jgi:hypothetical protein